MNQTNETAVSHLPMHPVVAAAFAAYDRIREWADGMLVGHTDFNKIFYDIITLMGKIKAGAAPDDVAKLAEGVAMQLCQLAEFFEQVPFNVKSYEELNSLGVELVALRKLKQIEVTPRNGLVAEISVAQQDLAPILQAIAGMGNKLDSVLAQQVVHTVSAQVSPIVDLKKDDVQISTDSLGRYREWLRLIREFETTMREERASLLEYQEGLKYGVKGIDRSTDIRTIEQLLSHLVEVRQPVEEATREIEVYLAAWKVVNRGVLEKYQTVTLPAFQDSRPSVEIVPSKQSDVLSAPEETAPKEDQQNNKAHLAKLGARVGANPAEVLFVSLFDLVPRGPRQARGYRKMMQYAFTSGLAQKFGWRSADDLEKEYQTASKESHVRKELMRMNGAPKGTLVLSRKATLLPWAVSDIFSDEEMESFKKLIG